MSIYPIAYIKNIETYVSVTSTNSYFTPTVPYQLNILYFGCIILQLTSNIAFVGALSHEDDEHCVSCVG